jgi:hypothetical protein
MYSGIDEKAEMKLLKIKNCVRRFLEEKEAKTQEGETIKLDEVDGLLITHEGDVFWEWVEEDNTIHNLPFETLEFPKRENQDKPVECPCPFPTSNEKSLLRKRVEDIVNYYLGSEGKPDKEGLVGSIVALAKNIMDWDKVPTYENEKIRK